VIFRRLRDQLDLIGREPLPEAFVASDDSAGFQMVRGPVHGEACIVIGRSRVHDVRVHVIVLRQFQRLLDHAPRVVFLMGLVEMTVAGNDLRFDIGFETLPHRLPPPKPPPEKPPPPPKEV
jgi:hypothetical protein